MTTRENLSKLTWNITKLIWKRRRKQKKKNRRLELNCYLSPNHTSFKATRLLQIKHTRIQNTSSFPFLTFHTLSHVIKVATYYPGGSEEISGVGLTAELCKCQKQKNREREYMIYFDSDVSSQGEREKSLPFANLDRDPWEKGSPAGRDSVLVGVVPFPWEDAFWARGCSHCLWSFAPVAAAKALWVGPGMASWLACTFGHGPPGGDGPTIWPACISGMDSTPYASAPQPSDTPANPPDSFMHPRCHIQREPPKTSGTEYTGFGPLVCPCRFRSVKRGKKCSFTKATNDHLSLSGEHFIRLHASMQKEENNWELHAEKKQYNCVA